MVTPIKWEDSCIVILDQRRLPTKEIYLRCRTPKQVADAIKTMAIRGAPAIGVAAAMGFALAAELIKEKDLSKFLKRLDTFRRFFLNTRPTAVNLRWALDRMKGKIKGIEDIGQIKDILKKEAKKIYEEDVSTNKQIGIKGERLLPKKARVLTYCNAGTLATSFYGTALGVIRAAIDKGKDIEVVACETRPLLQGARLTAWELKKDSIPVTLITDNAAGYFMKIKGVDLVIIGADRIALNGDTANKIGSYSLAILAKQHKIPFYIAAPISTFDFNIASGEEIPIEERKETEITTIGKKRIAPKGINVWNPAFDIIPYGYISGFITEKGIINPPFRKAIKKLKESIQ